MNQHKTKSGNLTYTTKETGSTFKNGNFDLKIILPENDPDNIFTFNQYNISTIVGGNHINAIALFLKKENDGGCELYAMANTYKHEFSVNDLTDAPGCEQFDITAEDCLVIVLHDAASTTTSIGADVATYLTKVGDYYEEAQDGPFQDKDHGISPRRAGMSIIKR